MTPLERATADQFNGNGKYYDWQSYTIKSGDTLSQIALDTMGDASPAAYNWIAQHNGIPNASEIQAGGVIEIPKQVGSPLISSISLNGHTIGDNFYPVFKNYQGTLGNPTSDVINYNGMSYQLFDKGSIVSSKNGTFPLYGGIRQAFLKTGGLEGWLGAPKSGKKGWGMGISSNTLTMVTYIGMVVRLWLIRKATSYQ